MTTLPIAVFGATGQQGSAVVDALLDRGSPVRALVRDPSSDRARNLAERGAELVHADADQPATITAALAETAAFFYLTTPAGPDATEGETRRGIAIADAAAASDTGHIVFSSVGGAERDTGIAHFDSKYLVEEHLRALPVPVTIIRPVFFMENLRWSGSSVEGDQLVVRLPLPDGIALQMISVRDIGRVAAAILTGGGRGGEAIEIAGDELTGSQIAHALGAQVGLPARYEALPAEVLAGQGDSEAMFRWFAQLPAYQGDIGRTDELAGGTWNLPTWLAAARWHPSNR